jgi:hypothetical protein
MVIFPELGTKTFILKTTTNSREVCSSMDCECCGKPVKAFDDFVLVGKYPARGQMWKWSEASYYVKPENYGKIYHKSCFMAALKKENAKP